MKKSRFAVALTFAAGLAPLVSHAQVVVTDPLGQVQWVQQVATLSQQLTTLKSELQTQEAQYRALTGNTGLGSLLPSDASMLRTNLPSNWSQVYGDALNGGNSGYNARTTQIVNAIKSKIDGMGRGDALDYANSQIEAKGATDRAMGEQAYNNEMAELNNIQSLTSQIDATSTPKEIADLQARISTARGAIEAEQTKLNLMASLQQSQDKILQHQQVEAARRYGIGTAADGNTAPNLTP
ncbi:type IV secretion system protein [Caballeronia telluris]|uniref:Type IV secretion system family protein n=1 Tax=Caballeronia telluris TaxID=326475 RepID=A0A158KI21_9BURK|nr:type IV secretion system protein [Caballeronia telluris]SAL80220.1 type IV secretion system family protein [Caballeronia telluris]